MSPRTTALRISTIVYGRQLDGTRVTYLHHGHDERSDRAVAEKIVLVRWRRRRRSGVEFSGARLSPSIWRALPVALGHDVASWRTLDEATIGERFTAARSVMTAQQLDIPAADIVHTLIAVCGTDRLQQLVTRHADPARWKQPGVPDLFLFMRRADGRVMSPRFVEVKRPDEPVRSGQVEEIAFLQALGFDARVLRLVERGVARPRVNARCTTVTPPGECVA